MPSLVDANEAEISVLPYLAILGAVHRKGNVARLGELGFMRIIQLVGDGLTAEPVADVVRVTINERDTHIVVENQLEIVDKNRIGKVACFLKGVEDIIIGLSVVKINAESLLNIG